MKKWIIIATSAFALVLIGFIAFLAIKLNRPKATTIIPEGSPIVWQNMFGDEFQDNNTNPADAGILAGQYVGIYFSASWCPPCKAFTPELVKFRNANKVEFEVVLVGNDQSLSDHKSYLKNYKMPWYTLRYAGKTSVDLMQKYKIKGIPALIVLDPEGKVVTTSGRNDVMQYGNEALARWKSKQ